MFRFLQADVFNASGDIGFTNGDPERRDVEQFLLAFDSDLAPVVGLQVTLRSDNATAVGPRIDLLVARATTPFVSKILGSSAYECDLGARVVIRGKNAAFRVMPNKTFAQAGGAPMTDVALRSLASTPGQEVTYTCMPSGWAP